MVVRHEFIKQGLHPTSVELGEVEIPEELSLMQKEKLGKALSSFGFELIDDKKSRIIEKIKNMIVDLVHHSDKHLKIKLSAHIRNALNHDYNYLRNLFSETEGTTIEQYFINLKIERVKELLVYDELSLSEIAHRMNYSSVAHLSKQFKKVTGLTPSHFKQVKERKRIPIENL